MNTTSVMQAHSGLSDRLSRREIDFTLPPGGSSEARGGCLDSCRLAERSIDKKICGKRCIEKSEFEERRGPTRYPALGRMGPGGEKASDTPTPSSPVQLPLDCRFTAAWR